LCFFFSLVLSIPPPPPPLLLLLLLLLLLSLSLSLCLSLYFFTCRFRFRFVVCRLSFVSLVFFLLPAGNQDPFPFTLLNVCLSTQAAITGPVIMMSQNRQGDLDRFRNDALHINIDV
jgi:hypothetical protein